MSKENVMAACDSRSRPFLKRQCKNSDEPVLIKKLKRSQKRNLKAAENGDDNDAKTMLLTDLPNEILGKILSQVSFGHLFKLELVCKRIRNVVLNVVWPKKDSVTHESIIQYTNYPQISLNSITNKKRKMKRHKIMCKSIKLVLSRAPNIQNINLSVYSNKLKRGVCSLLSMAPKLIKLDLSYILLRKQDFGIIARSCPMLEEISLVKCLSNERRIEDGLETLCRRCPNIKYINIAQNSLVEGNFFEFIPFGLLYLDLSQCYLVTSNAINTLVKRLPNLETLILDYFTPTTTLFQSLAKLKYLQINLIQPQSPFQPLDFTNFHELKCLCLFYNGLVTMETVESLQKCPKLKSLDLSSDTLDSNRTLELLKKCKALKYCNFRHWSNLNEGIIDFVQHNQVEYLDLTYCTRLSNNVVKSLINECESLTYLVMGGEEVNYDQFLLSLLSEKHSPRKNILKIIADSKMKTSFPKCKWCEIFPWNYSDSRPRPFPDLTNVQIQYQNEKNNIY